MMPRQILSRPTTAQPDAGGGDNSKASYSRLVGEDLESTFQTICGTLNRILEEASLLCRQPPDYDGGGRDE